MQKHLIFYSITLALIGVFGCVDSDVAENKFGSVGQPLPADESVVESIQITEFERQSLQLSGLTEHGDSITFQVDQRTRFGIPVGPAGGPPPDPAARCADHAAKWIWAVRKPNWSDAKKHKHIVDELLSKLARDGCIADISWRPGTGPVQTFSIDFPSAGGPRDKGALERCAEGVSPENGLTGQAQEEQYQTDIVRSCTGVDLSPCLVALSARANVDYFAASRKLVEQSVTPAQYLALSRDRSRKMRRAESDPVAAALLCTQADEDEDWVVNSRDRCPGTPELTATDDHGCPLGSLPDAPSPADVAAVIEKLGVLYNPMCSGAKVPSRVAAGAFYWPSDGSRGSYIIVGRVDNQPAGCPVWYQIDIQELTGPTAGELYGVVFREDEEHTNLVELGRPVPAGFIQFNPRPGDVGTRTRLATTGGHAKIRFRVRAINGNGVRGPWSLWKISTRQSCWALGFDCQEG